MLSEKERQAVRCAHSQVDFKFDRGGHMIEISADQVRVLARGRSLSSRERRQPCWLTIACTDAGGLHRTAACRDDLHEGRARRVHACSREVTPET